MPFCSTSNSSGITINDSNYNRSYVKALQDQSPSVSVKSCLLTSTGAAITSSTLIANCGAPATTSGSDTTVAASDATISSYVSAIVNSQANLTPPTYTQLSNYQAPSGGGGTDPAAAYAAAASSLRTSINNEYCYYYKCYAFALPKLLNQIASATPGDYSVLKNNCQDLNRIMTQILQVLEKITDRRTSTVAQYYTDGTGDVSKLNTEITTIQGKLKSQMAALQSNSLDTDLKAAMVDYTSEKNSSSRNMMAIYGFLNIVAVGMLVYLYRSSK